MTRWRRSSCEELGAEDLGHGAGGAAIVLEQLLEPVLRLGVADGESRVVERGGEDVRDAELVAIDRGRLFGTACGPGARVPPIPETRRKRQRIVVASLHEVLS